MSSEWKIVRLGDICEIKSGKRLPLGHTLTNTPTQFPYIRLVDIAHGSIQKKDLLFLQPETRAHIKRYVVNTGDVCLAIVGHTIGTVFYVTQEFNNSNLTENAARLTSFNDSINQRYIYYYLTSAVGQNTIQARKVGSAQGKLPLYNIKSFPISLPSKDAQDEIVRTLNALDDRITLLRETNKTLEAIAQAIFKSWFVDFDPVRAKMEGRQPEGMDEATAALFPDSFEESELGLVPKGWKFTSMADISTVGIGKTPPRKEQHWFSENSEDVSWVSIRDMGAFGTYTSDTKEYLTQESVDKFNIKKVPPNSVLMSFKMTIGRIAITERELTTNEAIAHFKLEQNSPISSEYIYLSLKSFDFNQLSSTSSIADAVNSKTVRQIPVLYPAEPILLAFQENISALFERIKNISQQARNLELIRDTLLPRLISGQLRLPEAQEQIESALT